MRGRIILYCTSCLLVCNLFCVDPGNSPLPYPTRSYITLSQADRLTFSFDGQEQRFDACGDSLALVCAMASDNIAGLPVEGIAVAFALSLRDTIQQIGSTDTTGRAIFVVRRPLQDTAFLVRASVTLGAVTIADTAQVVFCGNRQTILVNTQTLRPDSVSVLVLVSDPCGAPVAFTRVTLRDQTNAFIATTDSGGVARFMIVPAAGNILNFNASAVGRTDSVSVVLKPAQLALDFQTPVQSFAGCGDSVVSVEATLIDTSTYLPVKGVAVSFSSSSYPFPQYIDTTDLLGHAYLLLRRPLANTAFFVRAATVINSQMISDSAQLIFSGNNLAISMDSATYGATSIGISVLARNPCGKPLSAVPVTLYRTADSLYAFTDNSGVAQFVLNRPPQALVARISALGVADSLLIPAYVAPAAAPGPASIRPKNASF